MGKCHTSENPFENYSNTLNVYESSDAQFML